MVINLTTGLWQVAAAVVVVVAAVEVVVVVVVVEDSHKRFSPPTKAQTSLGTEGTGATCASKCTPAASCCCCFILMACTTFAKEILCIWQTDEGDLI